jgi:hypothetical protein
VTGGRVFVPKVVGTIVLAMILAPALPLMASAAGPQIWSPATTIAKIGLSPQIPQTQVVTDSTGALTSLWASYDGNNHIVQSSHSADGVTWTSPADLSAAGLDAYDPQIVVDPTGRFTVIWDEDNGTNDLIKVSSSADGSSWAVPVELNPDQNGLYPQITVDTSGTFTAVWTLYGTDRVIQASQSSTGTSWSSPVSLSAPGTEADYPQLVATARGTVAAVWAASDGTVDTVQARFTSALPTSTSSLHTVSFIDTH